MTSTGLIILIGWHRPLESNFANNMELLNECTTVWILYAVMGFSDYVPDPATRNIIGWAFVAVLGVFLAIHLVFLIGSTCKALYRSLRRCYYEEKKALAMEAIREKEAARAAE